MGTDREREQNSKSPQRRVREKNGNPTKGFGIAFCRAWAFLTLSILPLHLLLPLTLFPIWLRLFSDLGDSNFLPAMMQPAGTLPSRTLRGSFKSVFFCHENPTVGIVAAIGFYPCGKGEAEPFQTFVSRALGRGLQLHADSSTTEIHKQQRCFPVQRWQTKAAIAAPQIHPSSSPSSSTVHQNHQEKVRDNLPDNINNMSRS